VIRPVRIVGRVVFAGMLSACLISGAGADGIGYDPPKGFIPDAATAVRVAEAILIPIYGQATIAGERPFKAELRNGVWIVTGTLPPGYVGGTATIKISKSDGKVLYVMHAE
jgi:hypothetical protein